MNEEDVRKKIENYKEQLEEVEAEKDDLEPAEYSEMKKDIEEHLSELYKIMEKYQGKFEQKPEEKMKGDIKGNIAAIHSQQTNKIRDRIKSQAVTKGVNQEKLAENILNCIHEIQSLKIDLTEWESEFLQKFDHGDFSKGDFDQKTLDSQLHKYGS